ncbi:MAG: hypothetical protein OXD32_07265 [Endozoicomonadaceae bacterium]|nr:hypothetical protein [Endozoicomonadaceae bacterium]MCY4330214.1 hypothetical protein [Endozoicomonadaceae bacterium]
MSAPTTIPPLSTSQFTTEKGTFATENKTCKNFFEKITQSYVAWKCKVFLNALKDSFKVFRVNVRYSVRALGAALAVTALLPLAVPYALIRAAVKFFDAVVNTPKRDQQKAEKTRIKMHKQHEILDKQITELKKAEAKGRDTQKIKNEILSKQKKVYDLQKKVFKHQSQAYRKQELYSQYRIDEEENLTAVERGKIVLRADLKELTVKALYLPVMPLVSLISSAASSYYMIAASVLATKRFFDNVTKISKDQLNKCQKEAKQFRAEAEQARIEVYKKNISLNNRMSDLEKIAKNDPLRQLLTKEICNTRKELFDAQEIAIVTHEKAVEAEKEAIRVQGLI